MRSSYLAACGLLLAVSATLRAQVTWDFSAGTAAPASMPATITGGTITAGNATLDINSTSPSSGYLGNTGTNNAAVNAKPGAFSTGNSSYFEFTLTAISNLAFKVSSISLGSRSTTSGPTTLTLYSSADNFVNALGTAATTNNGAWSLATIGSFNVFSAVNGPLTFRLYGHDGTASGSGNWRVDDLNVNATTYVAPVITTPPATHSVAFNQAASFSVVATGNGALTYQWRKAGVPIDGNPSATTANLDLGIVTMAAAGTYDVVVTDSIGSAISPPATLTVTKAPAVVTVAPQSATYNGASHAAIATTTPAGLGINYSYTATSGTIYNSATPPTSAGIYAVTATIDDPDYQGTGTGTFTIAKAPATVVLGSLTATYNGLPHAATSTTAPAGISVSNTYNGSATLPVAAGSYAVAATVNHQNYTGSATGTLVITPAPITLTLSAANTVFTGSENPATVTTTPAGKLVGLTYTGINGTNYGPSATAPTNGGSYQVDANLADPNFSGTATATFDITAAGQTITFATPPDRLASAASFALTATSSSGLPVAFSITNGSPALASLAGDTVTLTGATGTVTVRASQSGNANYLAAADVERTFAIVSSATPPTFALQPVDTSGNIGFPIALHASVTGAPAPLLQWRRYGIDLPGATDATFTLATPTLEDTGLYQLIATNVAGTATSVPVALTITKRPQTISFAAPATAFPPGTAITLPVTASSNLPVTLTLVSGPASLTGNVITGAGGTVVVRATQPGNAFFDAAEPVERTFSFVAGGLTPFITLPPADQTIVTGGNATFRATAIGTPPPTYQWQKDGVDIASATTSTLTLTAVTVADTARYTLVATNSAGNSNASATLTVHAAPAIISSPGNQTVLAGAPAKLSVVATGVPAPTYQWRQDGTAIAGATTATLTFASTLSSHAGRYDVIVTNPLGIATSSAAELTVNTRNFSGTYFGQFSAPPTSDTPAGNFALRVRDDQTGVFLGHLPGAGAGLVTLNFAIDLRGAFSVRTTSIGATPRTLTLSGTIDEVTGSVEGMIGELGARFEGMQQTETGPEAAGADFYAFAAPGTADGRGFLILGDRGHAFVLLTSGALVDSGNGSISTDGRLELQTEAGTLVALGFSHGAVNGTVRTAGGATGTIAGARAALVGREHLANLSVRGTNSTAAPLITGFVITGTASKQVLIRAAGPALAGAPFNVAGVLADPSIQIFRGNTGMAQNNNWGTPAANVAPVTAATTRAGAFPFRAGSADAALLTTLAPGAYTVVVGGGNGATLAEIYEVLQPNETAGARRLANLSARGLVAPGAPLIAGLVIGGTAPQRVLIRGIGPTLGAAPFNLTGALANPQLTLYRGTTALRTNDDWFRDAEAAALIRTAATRVAAFALGAQSLDAALLLYLEPGAYTVQVSGPTNTAGTGIALVEVYESAP